MNNILVNITFLGGILFLVIGLFFHYRVQYLMIVKVRPFLRQHGYNAKTFSSVLKFKRDIIQYENLCNKLKKDSNITGLITAYEKKSWIFIVLSVIFIIIPLIFSKQ